MLELNFGDRGIGKWKERVEGTRRCGGMLVLSV